MSAPSSLDTPSPRPVPDASPGAQPAGTVRVTVLPHPELCPDGLSFEARRGRKLIDAMLDAGVAIEHACEKVCACATCHVMLREGGASVRPADEEEEDQLDEAWGVQPQSRLACCVRIAAAPLVVELPRYTKNHARER